MADENIATERVFREGADGVERLVAAPGDPVPEEDAPLGYQEKIDTRAATKPDEDAAEPEDFYEDPPPKPGEEAKASKAEATTKARKPAENKGT